MSVLQCLRKGVAADVGQRDKAVFMMQTEVSVGELYKSSRNRETGLV
jgi:hypothetical protein